MVEVHIFLHKHKENFREINPFAPFVNVFKLGIHEISVTSPSSEIKRTDEQRYKIFTLSNKNVSFDDEKVLVSQIQLILSPPNFQYI